MEGFGVRESLSLDRTRKQNNVQMEKFIHQLISSCWEPKVIGNDFIFNSTFSSDNKHINFGLHDQPIRYLTSANIHMGKKLKLKN